MATRKRKGVTGLAAVGIVAITLAGLWAWFLPAHRPTLRVGEELGLDVSQHQGNIDWEAVADDGISFVYIKATEGGDWTDRF